MWRRVDYRYTGVDGHTDKKHSGFEGRYLSMRVDGTIIPGLTYSWVQRFNQAAGFLRKPRHGCISIMR